MAKHNPPKIISKKHLARLEVERRQTNAIKYGAIGIIAAVLLIIGYGILSQTVLLLQQPVAKVGEEVITTREFQSRVRLTRQQYINQYLQIIQTSQLFGIDPYSDEYFSQQLGTIESQLSDSVNLGEQVLGTMIDELLIRQEAPGLGVTISEDEVEEYIHGNYGYYPAGTPTATPTKTAMAYSTLSPTQMALVTITPTTTPFPTFTQIPTATPDLTLTPTTTPTATATATAYTLEGFQERYKLNLAGYGEIGFSESDYRVLFANKLYYDRVFSIITQDVPVDQEQVWARHILVPDETAAQLIRESILNGEDWAIAAAEKSIDTSNKDIGGDLGWFPRGAMVAEFENVAFDLSVGEISQPVQTQFGWHLIQVLGHDMRPLEENQYQQAREARFSEWLDQVYAESDITEFEYWQERIPEEPNLEAVLNEIYGQ